MSSATLAVSSSCKGSAAGVVEELAPELLLLCLDMCCAILFANFFPRWKFVGGGSFAPGGRWSPSLMSKRSTTVGCRGFVVLPICISAFRFCAGVLGVIVGAGRAGVRSSIGNGGGGGRPEGSAGPRLVGVSSYGDF